MKFSIKLSCLLSVICLLGISDLNYANAKLNNIKDPNENSEECNKNNPVVSTPTVYHSDIEYDSNVKPTCYQAENTPVVVSLYDNSNNGFSNSKENEQQGQ